MFMMLLGIATDLEAWQPLFVDEVCQLHCVLLPPCGEAGVAPDPAVQIVAALAVPGEEDGGAAAGSRQVRLNGTRSHRVKTVRLQV